MYMKRVILANHSRLLLELFHRALEKAEHLEIVHEVLQDEELPYAIQRFCPEWVIVSLPVSDAVLHWMSAFMQDNSPVRFVFLSPDQQLITMKWQLASEVNISSISLKEFIHLLERDVQPI